MEANGALLRESFSALVDRLHAGCAQAARELYDRYQGAVACYLREKFRAESLSPSSTADLVQETWLNVLVALCKGMPVADERKFIVFLHRVVDRCFFRFHRARKAAKRSVDREVPFDLAKHDQAAPGLTAAEMASLADEWRFVLAALPPKYEGLFQSLHNGENLKDAAAQHGICERTAARWLRRISKLVYARSAAVDR